MLDTRPNLRHLLLMSRNCRTGAKEKFLCGHDERHWFVAAIPRGNAAGVNVCYTAAVLVAETGENRLVQMGITSESPSNLFRVINENHAAGQGPVDITGDPNSATFTAPCTPSFTTYYVANAGEGSARTADYQGGVIGTTIDVPGILLITSWWSR